MTITYTKDIVLTPVIYFKCKHKERMTCNNSVNCGVECHRTRSEKSADSASVKIALEFFKHFRIAYICDNDVIFSEIIEEDDNALQEPKYCDRNICLFNEYNGIGCDECEVTKSQKPCDEYYSRQDIEEVIANTIVNGESLGYFVASEILSDLQPVTLQQPRFDSDTGGIIWK